MVGIKSEGDRSIISLSAHLILHFRELKCWARGFVTTNELPPCDPQARAF